MLPIIMMLTVPALLSQQVGEIEGRRIDDTTLVIVRPGLEAPLLRFQAPRDGRPYTHPIRPPDGQGELTESSPSHHPHQTGLFLGFLKVNGRDYFHNRGEDHYRRIRASFELEGAAPAQITQGGLQWSVRYEWLGDTGRPPLLVESQRWTFRDQIDWFLLDLDWLGEAQDDIVIGRHDYGGLFLRMPWKAETGGQASNSEAQVNAEAEGQSARWIDVGLPIPGRDNDGHIAILDHPDNPGHPTPWRIDDQLGVGPAPSRQGNWTIRAGESIRFRYRLIVYTGETNRDLVQTEWERFAATRR